MSGAGKKTVLIVEDDQKVLTITQISRGAMHERFIDIHDELALLESPESEGLLAELELTTWIGASGTTMGSKA